MPNDILTKIASLHHTLPPSEAKVADWITRHPRLPIDSSIAKVASQAEVSEPTVIRFCRSLGLSGFRDLRNHLVAAANKPDSYLHHDVSAEDSPTTAVSKVLGSCVQALMDLSRISTTLPVEATVDTLSRARQIIFMGLGASGHVAQDACHKFFRLGIPCTTATDPQTILQRTAIASPGDVYILISNKGQWPDLLTATNIASSRGATSIALTEAASPLGQLADITLDCQPDEDTSIYTPMRSRLAQLALLDALQVSLALSLGPAAEENLKLTKAALDQSTQKSRRLNKLSEGQSPEGKRPVSKPSEKKLSRNVAD